MMRRPSGERGAVLIEFALIGMLLVSILFAIVEFGFGWEARLSVQNATRAGARVASGLGNDRLADYSLLQSVKSALGDRAGDVLYVVVYRSPNSTGNPPSGCVGSSPSSSTNQCNVYTGTQLNSLTQANFTGTTSCTGSSPDRYWCPTGRQVVQAAGTDFLGVYVRLKHDFITGLFGTELILADRSVMRLEPGG